MIAQWTHLFGQELYSVDAVFGEGIASAVHQSATLLALIFVSALLSWRLWRFTLSPLIHPNNVRELPYWIPYLGHAVGFLKDSHGTLTYGRQYFRNTRQPYILTLAGERFYILTSPDDIAAACKDTENLSFDPFVRDMMISFGATSEAVRKMWLKPGRGARGITTHVAKPERKSLAQVTRDFHKQQLHPGENQRILGARLQTYIDEQLRWEHIIIRPTSKYITDSSGNSIEIPLKNWCGDVLLNAATRAFFGESLLQIKPDLFEGFFDFDDDGWMLMYHYPNFMAKRMYRVRNAAIDALTKYFALPKESRQGEAWFVKTLEAEQRKLAIGDRDIATLMLMVYWAINSNTYKLCFWMLSYLLYDSSLLASIQEETSHAFNAAGDLSVPHLTDSSDRLNALFEEVHRVTNSASTVRSVESDTVIGGFVLRQGSKVLMPYRQLHFDELVYGADANEFDAERFLKRGNLSKSPSYRPFGGGSTYCPGRFIARQEVLAFIAYVLRRFELKLANTEQGTSPQKFPRLGAKKPSLGVMGPMLGDDLVVSIKTRKCT